MRQLLSALKMTIRGKLNYLKPNEIFYTIHEDILPGHIRQMGLGIKDGPISRRELAGEMWEVTLQVKLVLWSGWVNDDERLLGGAVGRGVLEMAEDVHAALDQNLLQIDNMIEAFSPSETESGPYGNESRTMQRKVITYQYVKEEKRP